MRTLCLGEAIVDLVCRRPVASLVEADAFAPFFGGASANVAVACARAGGQVALAGGAGADAWGGWLCERLEAEGVGTEWFALVEGLRTPVAFVTVDEHAEPMFTIYGEGIEATIEAVAGHLEEAVDETDALFIGSNTLVGERERELTLAARERALALGHPIVFDPNFRLHRWSGPGAAAAEARGLLEGCFMVKCNQREASLITGESDPEAAAAGLLAAGVRHVVITRGAAGAMLRAQGLRRDVPCAPVQAVNTTGAGDAFVGVLLARLGQTDFYPPALAAGLPDAVAAATQAVTRWGAVA